LTNDADGALGLSLGLEAATLVARIGLEVHHTQGVVWANGETTANGLGVTNEYRFRLAGSASATCRFSSICRCGRAAP
jgi:hypothetical protein